MLQFFPSQVNPPLTLAGSATATFPDADVVGVAEIDISGRQAKARIGKVVAVIGIAAYYVAWGTLTIAL